LRLGAARDRGNIAAEVNIGMLYAEGRGVPQD
jgi:TPR repeat protein